MFDAAGRGAYNPDYSGAEVAVDDSGVRSMQKAQGAGGKIQGAID